MDTIDEQAVAAIAIKHMKKWKENPKHLENGYEYEKTFDESSQAMMRELFALSISQVSIDRNKKKD